MQMEPVCNKQNTPYLYVIYTSNIRVSLYSASLNEWILGNRRVLMWLNIYDYLGYAFIVLCCVVLHSLHHRNFMKCDIIIVVVPVVCYLISVLLSLLYCVSTALGILVLAQSLFLWHQCCNLYPLLYPF